MKNILKYIIIFLFFLPIGCVGTKKVQYVPTQTEIRVEYRDSLIFIRDTIFVYLPVEEKEVKTLQDSSHLETSVAISDAWIDKENNLNHTLKNKVDTVFKYVYDTVLLTKTIKEYKEIPIITEVEKPVKYVPTLYKISMIICIILIGYFGLRLFLKFR